ncbi:acyl transferase/acyl hydrolase/lysophospholipase [Macrophomina phaseolina]|uniref:Acyl transferase/acyl hydrolase/lysophospholipase n=1 Tax=Macrophomina phaseolina TaxID=35725 RepID=A0ABQ8FRX0_9PEZI|nr:acyl transferase/acyl hydrolase/lysophospholipase [Macrophomina phaseolina]
MKANQDTEWLQLCHDEHGWHLPPESKLRRLAAASDKPDKTYPSIAMFVGKKSKQEALSKVFRWNNVGRRSGRKIATLHEDNKPVVPDYPLLFADVELDLKHTFGDFTDDFYYGKQLHDISWARCTDGRDVASVIVSRLLLPFADTVFLFAEDFCPPTPDKMAELLRTWASTRPVTSMMKPSLVIVIEDRSTEADIRSHVCGIKSILETFASIETATLTNNFSEFRKTVEATVEAARLVKKNSGTLFSFKHISALFDAAVEHTATHLDGEMDVISYARKHNPVDTALVGHLTTFRRLCDGANISESQFTKYVASSLVLDHMSPGMHCKYLPRIVVSILTEADFNPDSAFCALYRDLVAESLISLEQVKQTSLVIEIQRQFTSFCREIELHQLPVSHLHKTTLMGGDARSHEPPYRDINQTMLIGRLHSNLTCLCCLRRKPEHIMPCCHALCDACVLMFYQRAPGIEACYDIDSCLFCGHEGALRVKTIPPTASYRTAVFDGGGVRGVVSLELFKALDAVRDLPYSIHDDFDLAVGTSTGGLIVLLLFLERRSPDQCLALFELLAKRVFPPDTSNGFSFYRKIMESLTAFLGSGKYDATVLEACLEEVYGKDRRLFASPPSGISGTRVAITSVSAQSGDLLLFTNYNGNSRQDHVGYEHVRPLRINDEVLIKEAALATSAAPSIFPPKHIDALDSLVQDGGVGEFNNPIKASEWEARVLWPGVQKPDLVLSTGTGFEKVALSLRKSPFRNWLSNTTFPRLLRVLLSASNSEKRWIQFFNEVAEIHRKIYHRLNLPLDYLPALDCAEAMEDLRQKTRTHIETDVKAISSLETITKTLLSTQFFFVLTKYPVFIDKFWVISGTIRCRSPEALAVIHRILNEFPDSVFIKDQCKTLSDLQTADFCQTCSLYDNPIRFVVDSLDQEMRIALAFRGKVRKQEMFAISAFQIPRTVSWFIGRQRLDDAFTIPITPQTDCISHRRKHSKGPSAHNTGCSSGQTIQRKRATDAERGHGACKRRCLRVDHAGN